MKKKLPRSAEVKRQGIDPNHEHLSLSRQCQLLGLARSTWYYEPLGESAENLALMREIDRLSIKRPYFGTRKVREAFGINRKRAQRLMRLMGLEGHRPVALHLKQGPRLSNNWGPPQSSPRRVSFDQGGFGGAKTAGREKTDCR